MMPLFLALGRAEAADTPAVAALQGVVWAVPDGETNLWQLTVPPGWQVVTSSVAGGGVFGLTNAWLSQRSGVVSYTVRHAIMGDVQGTLSLVEPHPTLFLNATNYGARGDARSTLASCSNGSRIVGIPDLSSADVGRQVQILDMGRVTKEPYHEGYIGWITSVIGTNASLKWAVGNTSTGAVCVIGTDNAPAFARMRAAALAAGRTRIYLPEGRYLSMAPGLTNETVGVREIDGAKTRPGSWNWTKGTKVHLVGAGSDRTILVGNSAWRKTSDNYPWRGMLFCLKSPFKLDDYLAIDAMGLHGGVQDVVAGEWDNPINGAAGWGGRHSAIQNIPGGPAYAAWYPVFNIPVVRFRNCEFTRWQAEVTQGGSGGKAGNGVQQTNFLEVSSCRFSKALGSCINMSMNCLIRDCYFGEGCWPGEMYEDALTPGGSAVWVGNEIAGNGGLSFTGSTTNKSTAYAIVERNVFHEQGMVILGWKNLFITNNVFLGNRAQIVQAFQGQQPSNGTQDHNYNWWIVGNRFTGVNDPLQFYAGNIPVHGCIISNNIHTASDLSQDGQNHALVTVPSWSSCTLADALIISNSSNALIVSDQAAGKRLSYPRVVGNRTPHKELWYWPWEGSNTTYIDFGLVTDGYLSVKCAAAHEIVLHTGAPSLLWDGASVVVTAPRWNQGVAFTFNGETMTPPQTNLYIWRTNSLRWVKQ